MPKRGRPFTYQSEDKKPVTVSLRIPRDVYEQTQRYVRMHYPMTLTDLLLDGLRLRLETPADPRDVILSDDNTVIQELQGMIQAAVQAEIGKLSDFMGTHFSTPGSTPAPEAPGEPVPDKPHNNNTVLQESQPSIPLGADHPAAAAPSPQPASALSQYDNTVIQEVQEKAAVRKTGRPATMREMILALLREHPEGLSAEQIRGLLNAQKPIGDTLQGMRRGKLVRTEGAGREMRYFLAGEG